MPRSKPGRTRRPPAPAARAFPGPLAWRATLAAIFVVALLWRLAYLARLAQSPLEGSLVSDARSYWDWATYLLGHGFRGGQPFFLAPLYPYVLAALRLVLGDDPHRLLVVQAVWGSLAAVLLADAARRLTRPALGAVVGLAVAFARMAVFFDGLFLVESLLFALAAFALWWLVRGAAAPPSLRWALVLGALLGALAQGRATAAVLVVPALVLLAELAGGWRRAGRAQAALLAGFAVLCAPAAIHNARSAGAWIPFTYSGGYNLYVGNNPGANGSFVGVTGTHDIADAATAGRDGGAEADGRAYIEATTGERLRPAASSAWWADRALAWMRAHPARAASLAWRKVALAWNRHEAPQIENVDEFRLLAGPLGVGWLFDFAVFGALAMAGAVVAWRRGPRERWLVGATVLSTLALVPFFVTDRYRHQLVPAALLLAALALDELWRTRGRPQRPALVVAGAALGCVLAFWPVPQVSGPRYALGLAEDVGVRWLEHGRADLALAPLERAVAIAQGGQVRWAASADDSLRRGLLHYQHARVLERLGREGEALAALRRAAELAPGSRVIRSALAAALAGSGDREDAVRQFAAAGAADPALDAALARAWAAARAGRLDDADRDFLDVVHRDARQFEAWGALVRVRVQAGHVAAAREALDGARAAGWQGPAFEAHRALVLALEGHAAAARAALARVPARERAADPVLADACGAAEQLLAR